MTDQWRIPELAPVLQGADHVDVKVVEGTVGLREFVAAMTGYQPGWITALYGVRRGFVRLLGMRQSGIPRPPRLRPATVPMTPGAAAGFFRVWNAEEDRYWAAVVHDTHLSAWLAGVRLPLAAGRSRFYVITVVQYHRWTGPVYFNVIRPFHHLVVGSMAHAGVQPQPA